MKSLNISEISILTAEDLRKLAQEIATSKCEELAALGFGKLDTLIQKEMEIILTAPRQYLLDTYLYRKSCPTIT
jgi:hypothetical protein